MKLSRYAAFALVIGLAACGAPPTPEGQAIQLSPEVLAVVAPGQNLNSARVEGDGCYWYLHRGPVETTYLPLVTREGRMICTRPQG